MEHGLLVLSRERIFPGRHGSERFALRDGAQQFFIGLGGGGCGNEIPRPRREKRGLGAVAFTGCAMTLHAVFAIDSVPSIESFGGVGEQKPGAPAGQQECEKERSGMQTTPPPG